MYLKKKIGAARNFFNLAISGKLRHIFSAPKFVRIKGKISTTATFFGAKSKICEQNKFWACALKF